MKKSFSLLEIIVVVLLISIITSYLLVKSNDSFTFANESKIKSEIALIRDSINKYNTNKILLNQDKISKLDDASINEEGSSLFSNILDFPLISTSNEEKKIAFWIKISSTKYKIFLDNSSSLEFEFDGQNFSCKSEVELCKEYE